jgi:HEAT repeat protein
MRAQFAALSLSLLLVSCSTTEQQIVDLVEQLAASPIRSVAWQESVDGLVAIGRPAARQLVSYLNPDLYVGENYREFRDEQEKLRTGCALALGRIKPRGATALLKDRITVAYTDNERIACIWAIGEIGFVQAGVNALKAQLKNDKNPIIRLHAAIGLLKMDDDTGYGEIAAAFQSNDQPLAQIAIDGLSQAKHFGVPLLTQLVDHEGAHQAELRQTAAQVGGQLIEQLNAEDPELRRRAALALGQIDSPASIDALRDRLSDSSNQVRFSAAAALAGMSQDAGIKFLFDALRNPEAILRTNAVKFLAEVQKTTGAVEQELINALSAQEALTRAGAAQVLGGARVETAIAALQKATTDPVAEVRTNAAIALGHIGRTDSRPQLEALLDDANATVVYYAEWALGQLGNG